MRWLRYDLGKLLFLVCHSLTFAEIEHSMSREMSEGQLSAVEHLKRNSKDENSNCKGNFEMHHDKIIRTQDSKAMGARYLNERDVNSRDDCMNLCCVSNSCDVFVFEEVKVPGGCYLFECGPPENFKCKFTKYHNYTSGFLNINRHLTELESQIKYSQHERELAKLREPFDKETEADTKIRVEDRVTTVPPNNKEVLQEYGLEPIPSQSHNSRKGCSRNQFECHSSGECIAIYNACDGVPQCADGSDESLELGCPPMISTTVIPVKHFHPPHPLTSQQRESVPDIPGVQNANGERDMNMVPVRKQWSAHDDFEMKAPPRLSNSYQQKIPTNQESNNQPNLFNPDLPITKYGREGEEMTNYYGPDTGSRWSGNQYHHSTGSQIFNHKGEGLIPQKNHFQPQHPYTAPESQVRSGFQYDPGQAEMGKYYGDNTQPMRYNAPSGSLPYSWPASKSRNLNAQEPSAPQSLDEIPIGRGDIVPNGPYPDYYYEEMYKNKMLQSQQAYPIGPSGPYQQPKEIQPSPLVVPQPKVTHIKDQLETSQHQMKSTVGAPTTTSATETKTKGSVETGTVKDTDDTSKDSKVAHRKQDNLAADVKVKESLVNFEEEIHSNGPKGAVLSLTMGLCITGMLLILVGCRMRMVSKRMRRGGKGYAHDADFLVNGMYL